MLHDVDADLLMSGDDISYEDTDGNILGSGGYGKVICHFYLNTPDHLVVNLLPVNKFASGKDHMSDLKILVIKLEQL